MNCCDIPTDNTSPGPVATSISPFNMASETSLDAISRLASTICGTPIALITIHDGHRHWVASKVGLPSELPELAYEELLDGLGGMQDRLLAIPDTHSDERFKDSPLVKFSPAVRFFASAAIRTDSGRQLGTICVLDHRPRDLEPAQRDALAWLSLLGQHILGGWTAVETVQTARAEENEHVLPHRHVQVDTLVARRTQEIASAMARSERANQAKSRMISLVSHELRAPLHAIASFADIGMQKTGNEPVDATLIHTYFERIVSSANRLNRVVNNLLDLSRLESGSMQFKFSTTNLCEIVRSTVQSFESLVESRGQTLGLKCPVGEVMVSCDEGALARLLSNLLDNSIKYTPRNGRINVEFCTDALRRCVKIIVTDSGPGVPADALMTLFQPHARSLGPIHGNHGSGLGLALCREIAAAHHGRIWAENAGTAGLRVIVALPGISGD